MQGLEFGRYLRSLREKRELTIRQVEAYSGVSNAYLSQIENGKRGIPSPEILKWLAPVLKVSYESLMGQAGYLNSAPPANHSVIQTQSSNTACNDDSELADFFTELKTRDDLQILFKQVRPLNPAAVRRVIKYIGVIKKEEELRD